MQILARPRLQTLLSALCLGVFVNIAASADTTGVVVKPVEQEAVPTAASVPAQTEATAQKTAAPAPATAARAPEQYSNLMAAALPMTQAKERRERQVGTWSFAVEKMARAKGCQGGAWVTDKRDREATYEVSCENGNGAKYVAVCTNRGNCLALD